MDVEIKSELPTIAANPGSIRSRLALIGKFGKQKIEQETSVPFCVQWMVASEYIIPDSLDCQSFTGLLQCQLLRPGDTSAQASVLTYWRSKSHFEMRSREFVAKAGLVSCEYAMRQLADLRFQKRSLLPSSLSDALLKGSALVGAFTVCYQSYLSLFAVADVRLAFEDGAQIDVARSSQASFTLMLTNNDLSGPVRIKLDRIVASDGAWTAIVTDPDFFIEPGKRYETEVTAFTGDTGVVDVTVYGTAKSGRFSNALPLEQSVRAQVWPEFAISPFTMASAACTAAICEVQAELSVGGEYASGLECEVLLAGRPNVKLLYSTTSRDNVPSEAGEGADHVSKLVWREPIVPPFFKKNVFVTLQADPVPADWEAIVSLIEQDCTPI